MPHDHEPKQIIVAWSTGLAAGSGWYGLYRNRKQGRIIIDIKGPCEGYDPHVAMIVESARLCPDSPDSSLRCGAPGAGRFRPEGLYTE